MAARKKRAAAPRRARSGAATRARSSTGEVGSTQVVYIHGIGKQLAPEACKRAWDAALFGQDMGERSVMAYWADIRHPVAAGAVRAAGLDDVLDTLEAVEHGDEPVDVGRALRDAGVPKSKAAAARSYASQLARAIEAREPARTRSMQKRVLPLPSWARKRITKALTRWLIEDTAAYFFDEEQGAAMRARLTDTLRAVHGPVTLIAHSQGTLIAYDVLRELGREVDVALWITLGSPLGVTEVQDHLTKPLRRPAGVRAWKNFADALDPVALDGGLANDFSPAGSVEDTRVVNDDTLRLVGFNPHSATGYLRTAAVRKAVGRSGDPVARFFVAKDVAAEMSDPTRRLAVLIEIENVRAGAAERATLDQRRAQIVAALEDIVPSADRDDARIDGLRRFVSARLNATELGALSARREELHAYCVWKNAQKRKLVFRSRDVVHAGAANTAYAALGRGIHWAVLDTGVQGDHPHFAREGTIAAAWDCTRRGAPARLAKPVDEDGHGTHVAGIIAGREDADEPKWRGVAPLAKLHAYKVLDDDGGGEDGWIIKALDHVADLNEQSSGLVVHGVNLSLGGWFDPTVYGCGHSPICAELRRLWQQGVVVCIACGNEGLLTVTTAEGDVDISTDLSIGDPANLDEAIAVGSVNADKPHVFGISYFSSRGPTADGRAKPDLVAPGERISSCDAAFTKKKPTTHYREDSGTSMAAPHVSGLIAAFLSVRREFIGRPDLVKRILLDNCTDLGRDRYHQGAGLPNLLRMLSST